MDEITNQSYAADVAVVVFRLGVVEQKIHASAKLDRLELRTYPHLSDFNRKLRKISERDWDLEMIESHTLACADSTLFTTVELSTTVGLVRGVICLYTGQLDESGVKDLTTRLTDRYPPAETGVVLGGSPS